MRFFQSFLRMFCRSSDNKAITKSYTKPIITKAKRRKKRRTAMASRKRNRGSKQ